jgi:trans-aconitate methyltransferase
MRRRASGDDLVETFAGLETYDEARDYLSFHRLRYRALVDTVDQLVDGQPDIHVLDVGPSFQTALLRRLPGLRVSTLGFADPHFPPRDGETHTTFDLNDAQEPSRWPAPAGYHGLVLAEVIEHLYTSPTLVMAMLARLVRPDGWLLVQTPNAVALSKRVKMLAGRQPFEAIRREPSNPGHFREYTLAELKALAPDVGLRVESWSAAEYFAPSGRSQAAYRSLASLLPRTLRAGFTVLYRRLA